jgi:predicted  nucleic acid-binding Zn-ribbon protein
LFFHYFTPKIVLWVGCRLQEPLNQFFHWIPRLKGHVLLHLWLSHHRTLPNGFMGPGAKPLTAIAAILTVTIATTGGLAWADGTLESVDWDNTQHRLLIRCTETTEGQLTRVESSDLQRIIIDLPQTAIGTNLPRNEVILTRLQTSWPQLRTVRINQFEQGGPYAPTPLVRVVLDLIPSDTTPKWQRNRDKQISLAITPATSRPHDDQTTATAAAAISPLTPKRLPANHAAPILDDRVALQAQVQSLKASTQALQATIQRLTAELETARAQQTTHEPTTSSTDLANYQTALLKLDTEAQALRTETTRLEQANAQLSAERNSLKEQNLRLVHHITNLQNAPKADLQPKVTQLTEAYQTLQQQYQQLQAQLTTQQAQQATLEQLQTEKVQLTNQAERQAGQISQLQTALATAINNAQTANKQPSHLQPQLDQLSQDYQALQQAHQQAQTQLAQSQRQAQQDAQTIEALKQNLQTTLASANQAEAAQRQAAQTSADLQPQLGQLSRDYQALQQAHQQALTEAQQVTEQHQTLAGQLQTENQTLREQLQTQSQAIASLQAEVATVSRQKPQRQSASPLAPPSPLPAVAEMQQTLDLLSQSKQALEVQNRQLRQNVADKDMAIEALRTQLATTIPDSPTPIATDSESLEAVDLDLTTTQRASRTVEVAPKITTPAIAVAASADSDALVTLQKQNEQLLAANGKLTQLLKAQKQAVVEQQNHDAEYQAMAQQLSEAQDKAFHAQRQVERLERELQQLKATSQASNTSLPGF